MATSSEEAKLAPIELGWSSQRLKLRDETEDWTGITNQVERRKLQNRLNQRARRTRARDKDATSTDSKSPREGASNEDGSNASSSPNDVPISPTAPTKPTCLATTPRVQEIMQRFADHAYASYIQGTPALSHLTLLVRYNVSSALLRNAEILGVTEEYSDWEGISPFFKQASASNFTDSQSSLDWPANLRPTPVQCAIEHHPWLDVFPWPQVRDNMVQAFEYLGVDGEDELCHDVSQYDDHDTNPLLVVWGDAWDPSNWEITADFLRKWGWLLSGCEQSLDATNYWRAKRGERPISRKQLYEAIRSSMPAQFRHVAAL
ncbi:hypothetical protein CC86DRAFT_196367 [Ophiobolus disseminans]|uniref:BZIP domain-containing protein n=1 Tax=Ophiobolus disseminans TaxID=1469910 RepID=A0A6A7A7T7_9PLEO|nr:hypothetical protein CC86DRAFT_196367 [Ophiobolus disseminans]